MLQSFVDPSSADYAVRANLIKVFADQIVDVAESAIDFKDARLLRGAIERLDQNQAERLWRHELSQSFRLLAFQNPAGARNLFKTQFLVALWLSGADIREGLELPGLVRVIVGGRDYKSLSPTRITLTEDRLHFSSADGQEFTYVRQNQLEGDWPQLLDCHSDITVARIAPEETKLIHLSEKDQTGLNQARAIIANAPGLGRWVSSMTRCIQLVEHTGRDLMSGSDMEIAGTIVLAPYRPLTDAELIVHEASHQHFSLISKAVGLTKDGAPSVPHPLKPQDRPLIKVLLGFHAYGVLRNFYRHIAPTEAFDRDRQRHVEEAFNAFVASLSTNREWLTAAGREMTDLIVEASTRH